MEPALQVFLCHSSDDKAVVRSIYQRLAGVAGIRPWLDEEDIRPGANWDDKIREAILESHVVLICLSRSSTTKEGYIQKEIRFALDVADEKPDGTIFLIPLLLEHCTVPRRLTDIQWLDYSKPDAFIRLLSSLRVRGNSLGLELPQFAGRVVYDSRSDVSPQLWTVHSSVGQFRDRVRYDSSQQGLTWQLSAAGKESVGANRSLRCLAGSAHFAYKAGSGRENLYICMIPMEETGTGRAGLIEVGARFQGDPRNAQSQYRARYYVPNAHYGDGASHVGSIEFDFRTTPGAFYSIFAPRINEGVPEPCPGDLEVSNIQVYALD